MQNVRERKSGHKRAHLGTAREGPQISVRAHERRHGTKRTRTRAGARCLRRFAPPLPPLPTQLSSSTILPLLLRWFSFSAGWNFLCLSLKHIQLFWIGYMGIWRTQICSVCQQAILWARVVSGFRCSRRSLPRSMPVTPHLLHSPALHRLHRICRMQYTTYLFFPWPEDQRNSRIKRISEYL